MNGVLHSEHVISRSGIAVSPREVKKRTLTLLLFGALALRFFQPRTCGAKALFSQTHAEKLASRRFVGLSVLQQCTLFKFFLKFRTLTVAEDLHHLPFNVALEQHVATEILRI